MLELILKGRPRFYLWLCFLGAIFGLGFIVYIFQANIGLAITCLLYTSPSPRDTR